MRDLKPPEIVRELDKYIVGQHEAKRSVAIALRNRWRRQQVREHLRDEIAPKNIIMIGPTGVGKTEIARRLAKLANSPFLKIEASRFTEVGYVGRDVESMVRDLTELAVNMVRAEEQETVMARAREMAKKGKLNIYGMQENGGTHLIVLAKENPLAAGYTKVAKKALTGKKTAVEGAIGVPAMAVLALTGLKKFSDRRARIEAEEKSGK